MSIAIFRLILSLKVTPESLLHSRIKHSISPISIIIYHQNLREDCYINVKYDSTFLCKTIILGLGYVEFSRFGFNGLDLFILLMHIPIIISSTGNPHLHFLLLHI